MVCCVSTWGCARRECAGFEGTADRLTASQQIDVLRNWIDKTERTDVTMASDETCLTVEIMNRSQDQLSELLITLPESSIAVLARGAGNIVSRYDETTSNKLCSGLGKALGTVLLKATEKIDTRLYFRSGYVAAHFRVALRASDGPGWRAFESGVRNILPSPPLEPLEQGERRNPWDVHLTDLLLKCAGDKAKVQGLDPETWAGMRGSYVSGRVKAEDPERWKLE
jgi:hypothetical protein